MDKIDRLELHSSITKVTNNNTSVIDESNYCKSIFKDTQIL